MRFFQFAKFFRSKVANRQFLPEKQEVTLKTEKNNLKDKIWEVRNEGNGPKHNNPTKYVIKSFLIISELTFYS